MKNPIIKEIRKKFPENQIAFDRATCESRDVKTNEERVEYRSAMQGWLLFYDLVL